MGRLENKVAVVTGAARGQGRSHCARLAAEGADIIAIDICEALPGVPYEPATFADLEQTARDVESLDRRVVIFRADVRDALALQDAVDSGVGQFGRLDIVSAQAGISHLPHRLHEVPGELWQVMLDVTLTGTWNTIRAAIPHMIASGRGGSITITSSLASLRGSANVGPYVAAKHGLVGLVRTASRELGEHKIRVNNLAPTNVATDMLLNQETFNLFCPDRAPNARREEFEDVARTMHALPIPYIEPIDVSNALAFLASDEARYITGITLPIDAGASQH